MTYAIRKNTTKLMPLWRHKRSQNAGALYVLVDVVVAAMDALMWSPLELKVRTIAVDQLCACSASIVPLSAGSRGAAQRLERRAKVIHERLRLFPGREVGALAR